MAVTVFIGDEVSAAGYRLCGVEAHAVNRDTAASVIEHACSSAKLVLIGSSTVQYLDDDEHEDLMCRVSPLVLIVPDITGGDTGGASIPDIAASIHKQLGMIE